MLNKELLIKYNTLYQLFITNIINNYTDNNLRIIGDCALINIKNINYRILTINNNELKIKKIKIVGNCVYIDHFILNLHKYGTFKIDKIITTNKKGFLYYHNYIKNIHYCTLKLGNNTNNIFYDFFNLEYGTIPQIELEIITVDTIKLSIDLILEHWIMLTHNESYCLYKNYDNKLINYSIINQNNIQKFYLLTNIINNIKLSNLDIISKNNEGNKDYYIYKDYINLTDNNIYNEIYKKKLINLNYGLKLIEPIGDLIYINKYSMIDLLQIMLTRSNNDDNYEFIKNKYNLDLNNSITDVNNLNNKLKVDKCNICYETLNKYIIIIPCCRNIFCSECITKMIIEYLSYILNRVLNSCDDNLLLSSNNCPLCRETICNLDINDKYYNKYYGTDDLKVTNNFCKLFKFNNN